MTKKDFKLFADMIVELYKRNGLKKFTPVDLIEQMIVDILKTDNPNFDRTKWNNYISERLIVK
jgi:hypothetical protein